MLRCVYRWTILSRLVRDCGHKAISRANGQYAIQKRDCTRSVRIAYQKPLIKVHPPQ
jgi:hypothetical protein